MAVATSILYHTMQACTYMIHLKSNLCVMKDEREKSGNTEKKVGIETAFTNVNI